MADKGIEHPTLLLAMGVLALLLTGLLIHRSGRATID
jgi:hypothetical protein